MTKILFYETYTEAILDMINNNSPNLVIKGIPQKYKHLVSEEELPKLIEIVEEDIDYKTKRKMEYPPAGDQLDAIFKFIKGFDDGTLSEEVENYIRLIEGVKDKYPKKNN